MERMYPSIRMSGGFTLHLFPVRANLFYVGDKKIRSIFS